MSASASGGEKGGAVAVHWFRKGLRLHDNPALVDACKGATQVSRRAGRQAGQGGAGGWAGHGTA